MKFTNLTGDGRSLDPNQEGFGRGSAGAPELEKNMSQYMENTKNSVLLTPQDVYRAAYSRGYRQCLDEPRDKTKLEVVEEKVNHIMQIVDALFEAQWKRPGDVMKQPVKEAVYEIYVGGRATGIQGTRSDLENRVVAVAPAETVPLKSMEEFVKGIPINHDVQYPAGSEDDVRQKKAQKSYSYDHV